MRDDRSPTLAEQWEELNHHIREIRDEAILKPVAKVLNAAGIETAPIDEVSENVSLLEQAGAYLLGPVLAHHGAVLGFYAGMQLTHSPDIATGLAVATGCIAGAIGLLAGPKYLITDKDHETS